MPAVYRDNNVFIQANFTMMHIVLSNGVIEDF